jgi:hypothetical protein
LKDVAAIFIDKGERNGIHQACSIRFDRHPSSADGIFLEEGSPIPHEVWTLEPKAEGKNVIWRLRELDKIFTTSELASQIAIRLIRHYESYEHAFGR